MKYPPTIASPAVSHASRRRSRHWSSIAAVASVLIAVLVAGLFVAAQLNRRPDSGTQAGAAASSPDAAASGLSPAAPFNCLGSTSLARGPAPALAYIQNVGLQREVGYDRLTIQFTNGGPALADLVTQDGTTFTSGGKSVTLSGRSGALLTLHGTDDHTHFSGPFDLKTGDPAVLEVRNIDDAAGTVRWAVGLSRKGCYRIGFVDHATRLVVDFQVGALA